MDRGNSKFRGYLYSDIPREKAVIAEGLHALDENELSQIPEAGWRFDHLYNSAVQDRFPGRYLTSAHDLVFVRHSDHQFLRVGPAELPLAIAAAEKATKSRSRKNRRVAKELSVILKDELKAFRETLSSN